MTPEQLYDSVRAMLPSACRVQVDVSIATGHHGDMRASVDLTVNHDGRECWITGTMCEQVLASFTANVEGFRFGEAEVRVGA